MFMLTYPAAGFVKPSQPEDGGPEEPDKLPMNILHVCHQIYIEASNILYSSNAFFFDDPVAFQKFKTMIGSHYSASLRNLCLKVEQFLPSIYDRWTEVLNTPYLQGLRSLRTLSLLVRHGQTHLEYQNSKHRIDKEGFSHLPRAFCGFAHAKLGLSTIEVLIDGMFFAVRRENPKWWTKDDQHDYARCIIKTLLREELDSEDDEAGDKS